MTSREDEEEFDLLVTRAIEYERRNDDNASPTPVQPKPNILKRNSAYLICE